MKKIFTSFWILFSAFAFGQTGGVAINPNGSPPDHSAILDVNSTNRGLLMPRLTTSQRDSIVSPALGLAIFNITDNCYEGYGFGNWQTISCLCTGAPSTPGVISGNNNPCTNATSVTYTVGLILGATTYTWTVPADATIIAGQGTNSVTINFGSTPGNITVAANNSCGSSSPSTLPVTINTLPSTPGTIVGNPYPCANSTAQAYYVLSDTGATSYTWSVPSGSIVTSGQGTNSVLVNFYSTPGNLAVTANNACGSSSASTLPISMAITPNTPADITGPSSFNSNQGGLGYSIEPVTEAVTYTWTVPADATIASGQGSDSITVNFGGDNGKICVTAANCEGTSSSSCYPVTNTCYSTGTETFNYTGSLQYFTVPCGVISVTMQALGAQGGSYCGNNGGEGASMEGTFAITEGAILNILVGQEGQADYGGGGGGSFVVEAPNNTPLLIAGGGGGAYCSGVGGAAGTATTGSNGSGAFGTGGSNGGGGGGSSGYGGAGGGGFCGNGGNAASGYNSGGSGANGCSNGMDGSGTPCYGTGGYSYLNGGNGGSSACYPSQGYGGYGGGGASINGNNNGGGGGGYSGGGGGGYSGGSNGYGGGGGSYNAGTNQTNSAGAQTGNGQVIISW